MTDVAIIEHQAPSVPTHRRTGKPLKVTGALSTVLDLMVEKGMTYAKACVAANLHPRSARKALDKPHVLNELRRRKQVFRAGVSAANVHRLAELRDQDDNKMAAISAIKVLEQIDEEAESGAARRSAPGVTIIIGAPPPPPAPVTIAANICSEISEQDQ